MKIAIIHPNLGIGGAEKLISIMAKTLAEKNSVTILTSFYDDFRCFEETKSDSIKIKIFASFLPSNVFGKFHIFFALLKSFLLSIQNVFQTDFDFIICDQIPLPMVILKPFFWVLGAKTKFIFYCHFPDFLLTKRENLAKKLYRFFFDHFEKFCIKNADQIIVNSKFTQKICENFIFSKNLKNFDNFDQKSKKLEKNEKNGKNGKILEKFEKKSEKLGKKGKKLENFENDFLAILYPPISKISNKKLKKLENFGKIGKIGKICEKLSENGENDKNKKKLEKMEFFWKKLEKNNEKNAKNDEKIILSINRFERKKNIDLTIKVLDLLKKDEKIDFSVKLIIAGGYDKNNKENVDYFEELKILAKSLKLTFCDFPSFDKNIIFFRDFNDEEKSLLFNISDCVLYTPENEHFGIVPLEAMLAKKPIIAANSGGPLETILHGKTGYLTNPDAENFAKYVKEIFSDKEKALMMGKAGKKHVLEKFSITAFKENLEKIMAKTQSKSVKKIQYLIIFNLFFLF